MVRVYKDSLEIEFEWMVGPIPIDDGVGREIVTRFDTDIKSNGIFYTDANGREMLKRQRNHRETWDIDISETIAANYYPITSKIAIEDDTARLAILNERAQGGGSLADGSIELMVHRRLLHDDAFGVGEALNETAYGKGLIARGTHYLVFNTKKSNGDKFSHATERFLQLKQLLQPWTFFSDVTSIPFAKWHSSYTNEVYTYYSISGYLINTH